jgi:hypothetical protein
MRRLGRRMSHVVITAGVLLAAPGFAPQMAAQQALTEVSTEQLQQMLEGVGYEVEQPKEHMLQFAIEGHTAMIVNKKTNIQFYSFFKKRKSMDLKKVTSGTQPSASAESTSTKMVTR